MDEPGKEEGLRNPPPTPGRFIELEFLESYEISVTELAHGLRISEDRAESLVSSNGRIDGELALRLSTYFGNSPRFWMNLQSNYDLQTAEMEHGEEILREVEPRNERA